MYEYFNFYHNSKFYLKENFNSFNEKMMESYNKNDLLWNIFDRSASEMGVNDRESTIIIKQSLKG